MPVQIIDLEFSINTQDYISHSGLHSCTQYVLCNCRLHTCTCPYARICIPICVHRAQQGCFKKGFNFYTIIFHFFFNILYIFLFKYYYHKGNNNLLYDSIGHKLVSPALYSSRLSTDCAQSTVHPPLKLGFRQLWKWKCLQSSASMFRLCRRDWGMVVRGVGGMEKIWTATCKSGKSDHF